MSEKRIEFLYEEIERLTAELHSLTRLNIVCGDCGSEEVTLNAAVCWDVETQEYMVVNIFDAGHECGNCGNACNIKQVPA